MRLIRLLPLAATLLIVAGCDEDPLTTRGLEEPPPPTEGIQAFLQVDNDRAQAGDQVHLYVKVQFGTQTDAQLGSFTGRLKFDPEAFRLSDAVEINDGLRVTNPNGAKDGEIRFAGAAPRGFENLTIFHGVFEVLEPGFADALTLEMEELSAAESLTDLQPQLKVAPQVFLRRNGN